MDFLETQQILTTLAFLAVLGLAWVAVQMNKGRIGSKIKQGRRLVVCEAAAIGAGERAVLIEADGQPMLAILPRKGQAQIVPLAARPTAQEETAQ